MKRILIAAMFLWACGIVLPLFANLPCENDDCEEDCCTQEPEEESKCCGDQAKDNPCCEDDESDGPGNGLGNDSKSGGSGGENNSSLNLRVNWGSPANENIGVRGRFSLYASKPSPTIYSPQMLQYENQLFDRISVTITPRTPESYSYSVPEEEITGGGYSIQLRSDRLGTDVQMQVKLFTKKREHMVFEFKTGESIGHLVGQHANLNYTLQMMDASGNPVTSNPTYYDLYKGKGGVVRYSVETGKVVFIRTASGRTVTPDSTTVGIEPIYDSEGIVRQIWSLSDGLADIVVTDPLVSYEIRCYSPDQVGPKVDGVYTVSGDPHTVWKIENPSPGSITRVWITRTVNGVSELSKFEYSYNAEGWVLKRPDDLAVVSKTASWNPSRNSKVVTKVTRSVSGVLASKQNNIYQIFDFGERLVVNTLDPDGANLRTVSTYYTDKGATGSYGRKRSVSRPDGSWVVYGYDANGRRIQAVTPWKNSAFDSPVGQAKVEYFTYASHDSRDVVENNDKRPRTEETKILGITTSKTYHAYYFDNNCYVEVEERCTTSSAAYGDASNLRTVKRYYAKGDCSSPSAGRLHTIAYPNGTQDTYTYEYGAWTPNADPVRYKNSSHEITGI